MISGGCQCGAVRYQVEGEADHAALCHCADCRASAGAPVVGWIAFKEAQFSLTSGALTTYARASGSIRQFCPICGTGLFFRNAEMLPGVVDIQSATLDDPEAAAPQVQVQCAERLSWMKELAALPEFERFPGGEH